MGDLAIDEQIILTSALQKTCRRLHTAIVWVTAGSTSRVLWTQ